MNESGVMERVQSAQFAPAADLKRHLDCFLDQFPRERHLSSDPVRFVHRYRDPGDREVAGLIASAFAYGNVKSVLQSVDRALRFLGDRPAHAVLEFDPRRQYPGLRGFYHRFNTGRDLAALFWMLRRTLEEHQSLENAFAVHMRPGEGIAGAMERFCDTMLGFGHEQFYPRGELRRRIGVRFLFPVPSQGSACKRMNLFLRWMVRSEDGIDCGVWSKIRPADLVIPLDTHIARISGYLGLTSRRSAGWAMAQEITSNLKRLHPDDPLRYDFALCHLGIAGDCPRRRDPVKCRRCPIQAVCRLYN